MDSPVEGNRQIAARSKMVEVRGVAPLSVCLQSRCLTRRATPPKNLRLATLVAVHALAILRAETHPRPAAGIAPILAAVQETVMRRLHESGAPDRTCTDNLSLGKAVLY